MEIIRNYMPQQAFELWENFSPKDNKEMFATAATFALSFFSSKVALVLGACYLGYKWMTAEKVDYSEIRDIYKPTRFNEREWAPYKEKLAELKRDPNVIGATFVSHPKNGKLQPIFIKKHQTYPETVVFVAYDLRTNDTVGFAEVKPFLETNNYLEDCWLAGLPDEMKGYGTDKDNHRLGKVYMHQVTNERPEHYKNIGVVLTKAVLQHYHESCQGRTMIDAVRNTQPYWYKLGFRVSNPDQVEKNVLFGRIARRGQKVMRDMGSVYMHLPEKAQKLWLHEIEQHPIVK